MKKIIPILWTLIVLAVLVAAAWKIRTLMTRPPEVDVTEVVRQDVRRVLALTGRIRPEQRNQLVPAVRARLLELTRDEGDGVRQGELLARLDARQVTSDLAQAKLALGRDEDELAQRRRDLERASALAREELLPDSELEAARLDVVRLERRVEEGSEALAELEARLDDYVLRSPLDGYVLERPVDPGQVVGPENILYELATASAPEVEMEVDERYLAEISLGQEAVVAPLGGRGTTWRAEVSYIGRLIDRLSGAVIVRCRFTDEAPDLPVGLSLEVNLAVAEHPGALTVPRSAVAGLGGDATWTMVLDGDVTRRQEVEVIDWPAPWLVVRSGLKEGQQVVLEPRRVAEGIQIRPVVLSADEAES